MTRGKFAGLAGMILVALSGFGSVVSAADAVLLNFTSDHCHHCQVMVPTLNQLAQSGVPVRHVNVAQEADLARRFGIRQTPTFVVLSGGKELTRLVGAQPIEQLRAAVETSTSGPLLDTGAKTQAMADWSPQTRLTATGGQPVTPSAAVELSGPRSEAMPSISLAQAVELAQAATVRLRVHDGQGYGAGTGTIIDTHGEEALVLTCGHLFRESQGQGRIEVDMFLGGQVRTVEGQLIDFDADSRDIALVAIRPGFAVQPVAVIAQDESVQSGQTAFSFGCDRGADPSRRDTRITGINRYNQHLGVSNLEIAGAPIDGRSGGGLFDAQGRLIGVCNSADYKGDVGIYAGPGNIKWQLDRVDLAHLYQSSSPDRLASLPTDAAVIPAAANVALAAPANTPAASFANQIGGDQEVIVIVRDRNRPNATSQVMTLANPSPQLMQMIQQQSR